MFGLLFIGGNGPSLTKYKLFIEKYCNRENIKVAADSGLELAVKLGVEPDYIIGDMDSLSDRSLLKRYTKNKIIEYPVDKDETDTEIGIRMLKELGYNRIIIIGGGEGRLDHTIAIERLFERNESPEVWLTNNEEIYKIEREFYAEGWKGNIVSLFPLGELVSGMISRGLKWKLSGLKWTRKDFGISNLVTEDELYIAVENGKILLIRNYEL